MSAPVRRVAAALLPALLLACAVHAGPVRDEEDCGRLLLVESAAEEEAVQAAVIHLLNFRMRPAEEILHPLAERATSAPAAHYLMAMGAFLTGLVSDRAEDFERFHAHADSLEQRLNDYPESCWSAYLHAESRLQRAVVAVKQESYVRAAWHGRAAYKQYERAKRRYPEFVELDKGLGLMHFGLGALPGTWRRFLRILGYSGSVQQGLAELDRAARHASIVNRDAALLASGLAHAMLGIDKRMALDRLRAVHLRHPESPFFGYLYAYALLMERDASGAEALLRRYAGQKGDGVHQYVPFVEYYLGRTLFVQDRFAESEFYLRSYLATHRGPSLKAAARLLLGQSLELQGRREEAISEYRQVRVEREYDIDAAAYRAAQRLLRDPIEGIRRTLILGANAYDSGRYDRAESLLSSVRESRAATAEEEVEAAFRLGRVAQARGDAELAMKYYLHVRTHARDPEARWAPWATLHIAELHRERENVIAARRAYEDALTYRGPYDYQQSLEQNARTALELLDEKR